MFNINEVKERLDKTQASLDRIVELMEELIVVQYRAAGLTVENESVTIDDT